MNFTTRTCVPQFVAEYLSEFRRFYNNNWLNEDFILWHWDDLGRNPGGVFKKLFKNVTGFEQFESRCFAAMSNPKNTPEDILLILSM